MISQLEGRYSLSCGAGSPLEGTYTYKPFEEAAGDGGELFSGSELVGIFSYNPMSSEPLPADQGGSADIPCIRIANGEIMASIAHPSNAEAYFVLPSQLNGAEYPSDETIVDLIDSYKYDQTGGPRGQLAVHPAAGQFVIDNASNKNRQNGINAIDMILMATSEAGLGFQLRNGYLAVPDITDPETIRRACEIFKQHLHTLRPLVMEGIPASGLDPSKRQFSKATHRVSLVYASAIPVGAYMNLGGEFTTEIAQQVLTAQYYGALKVVAGRRPEGATKAKVFLMPLGGGVFNNPWEVIARGMSLAVEMLTETERSRLDIQALAWVGNPTELRDLSRLLRKCGKLDDE